ncbi:MAG: hypothetical protein V7K21_15105 [Nostoc sp.]|uniref:hypothetical protein n=1 Tax=Nostoc sp. TaxID=1180 RepID=UPI002FF79110
MENIAKEPRFFDIELLQGESLSHFLGHFRRENYLTATQLSKLTGLGAVIGRWEKCYFNPFPTQQELEPLAGIVEVQVDKLLEMLPPKGMTIKPRPIRLCGACYAESPYHRIEWQFKDVMKCVGEARRRHRHNLRLLTKCTNCETPFPIPADWVQGECPHCFLPFATMAKRQKRL